MLPLLLMAVTLVSGCGYSLELSKLEEQKEENDPIMLIRRNIRQIRADHRVALFDLRKEQHDQIRKLNRKLQETQVRLSRRSADIDERISEMEVHHRLIQGSIEEEANRIKEISEQASSFALRELEELKKDFFDKAERRKKLEQIASDRALSIQKSLKDRISALRAQIDLVKAISGGLEKSLDGQSQVIKSLSEQLSQVIEKVLPAVNGLGGRVDALELQLNKLETGIDMDALNRRLSDMMDAVDVQRQSLEMLGNTLTSQVDEQRVLLRNMINQLRDIESTPSSKPQ